MRLRQLCSVTLVVMVLLCSATSSSAIPEDTQIYDYHFSPFLNKTYVNLEPGESTENTMGLHNRYNFTMENAVVELEIYLYQSQEDDARAPDQVDSPPSISPQGMKLTVHLGSVQNNSEASLTHSVKTTKDTPQGTYFIRFKLEFDANNSHYMMWSRGHFHGMVDDGGNGVWKDALSNRSVNRSVEGENISTGGIDLVKLEENMSLIDPAFTVDGIVEDTSISVSKPFSMFPFFLLVCLAAFFGIAAVVFYLQETRNMFPKAEWKYQQLKGKLITTKLHMMKRLKRGNE